MRSLLDTLLHPRRTPPPPLDVDLARVMSVGTVVWALALVVTGAFWAFGAAEPTTVAVCAAGTLVGVVGVVWARRLAREQREAEQDTDAA
ncbi:DUF2530 domain-containing protein [Cellulomonas shaoxiangyii]|uniref:DUF2530 domain-containing protein n=1 Tax=Cellulomonas shaoxiangyii TaxID=2566013 RepID=A0A4P7SL92_9CELL|nr:DUF2530 domain-containing protein [Cellulomonas shaoxiangyii]QCB94548.1 DUF2530 domain-containing protein [Cellulomonas shaoxiangyii]TGY82334.1 DUF2530 domain-containing protein [Cellulomonas shaoxiangyii]